MKKTGMLAKISVQYWRQHKKRFLTLMLILVLGSCSLCSTALLIRSEKEAVLEEELRLLGNFDLIAYVIDDSIADKAAEDSEVLSAGKYYELGFAEAPLGGRFSAAAFADENSEQLYHLTCTRGHYPENENEAALDILTAKAMGIKPYPGERITLSLYSADGGAVGSREYTVCGLFESSDPLAYGGSFRYPASMGSEDYTVPTVFLYRDQKDVFESSRSTAFYQSDSDDLDAFAERIVSLSDESVEREQINTPNGRRFAYSYVLGISRTIEEKYGDNSPASIIKAMDNGDAIKDFYSEILMPIFTAMIFIIVILSVIGIIGNIIRDKRECFAVLSSLGLEQKQLRIYIACDVLSVSVIFTAIGTALGFPFHICMISLLNSSYDLRLGYGFSCSEYVRTVTGEPVFLSVITLLICTAAAVFISLKKLKNRTPTELFSDIPLKHHYRKASKKEYRGWKGLLMRRLRLCNKGAAVVSIIVMSSALFGYTYFHALSDQNNSELIFEKQEYGLDNWDYKAERSGNVQMYEFNIENHHDYGISRENYSKLSEQSYVKSISGRIVNRSTRLVFKNVVPEQYSDALKEFDLRKHKSSSEESELDKALAEAEEAMIMNIGFNKDDSIFSLPTVGLFDADIESLDTFVAEGKIDLEKLRSGEEALLVMTELNRQKFIGLFHVGDDLPVSDILLNDAEEALDFAAFDPSAAVEPVYKKRVTADLGNEVELTSYAFGKRKDIKTKVGAVLVLDSDAAKEYMTLANIGSYGMNLFCSVDAFGAWGLKNSRLTSLAVELESAGDVADADVLWYNILSDSKGMTSHSTAEISANMNRGTLKIMSVYYTMIFVVTVTAAVTIAISLYTDIRMRGRKLAALRACGMSLRQILFLILINSLIYPVIGSVFSVVPLFFCQRFFGFISARFESGAWTPDNAPWAEEVPFGSNLFEQNTVSAMAIIFAVYMIVTLIVTVPQLVYLKKRSISEEIESSSF